MVDHGKVRSTIRPERMVIDEYSVWICENITEVEVEDIQTGSEETEVERHIEYEYDMVQYEKNEFIKAQSEQITDTELALCEIYESLGV